LLARGCAYVPHGVPRLSRCAPEPFKKALGAGSRVLLLCGGLLSPPKGIELLIQALPLIAPRVPSVLLAVVGAPHPGVGGAYVASLRRAARRAGVRSRVSFLTRFLPQSDMEHVYQSADIFLSVHLDAEQASSGTLLSAMAGGAAVISTPFAQAAELLADGVGVLVPFNNVSAIADAVIRLVEDPGAAAEMRARAHALMAPRTWSAVAARYAQLAADAPPSAAATTHTAAALPPPAVSVHASAAFAQASNGIVAVAATRNAACDNGTRTGCCAACAYVLRHRPLWGLHSLQLSPATVGVRSTWAVHATTIAAFDDDDAPVTAWVSSASDAAFVEETWSSDVLSSTAARTSAAVSVRRRLSLSSDTPQVASHAAHACCTRGRSWALTG
jgi:hypothetical protein